LILNFLVRSFGDKIIIALKFKLKQIKWIIYYFLVDHLLVNLFHQPLTAPELGDHPSVGSPDELVVLLPRMLHDLLCRDPLLWADLEKLGDQVLGRP
jgi:hypothetical protein